MRIPASSLIHTWGGGGEVDGMRASDESIALYFCPERRISKNRMLTLVAHYSSKDRVLTLVVLPGLE